MGGILTVTGDFQKPVLTTSTRVILVNFILFSTVNPMSSVLRSETTVSFWFVSITILPYHKPSLELGFRTSTSQSTESFSTSSVTLVSTTVQEPSFSTVLSLTLFIRSLLTRQSTMIITDTFSF